MNSTEKCCSTKNKNGLFSGLLYGIIPHSFCILFILFSILGAAGATLMTKKFLLIPHLFLYLLLISFFFATLSAILYLKKNNCYNLSKIKNKWKYILTLYTSTIITNLIFIFVIFPVVANAQNNDTTVITPNSAVLSINTDIPCSGHAPLIISEIKDIPGVNSIKFKMPDTFEINFDPQIISAKEIKSQKIFKEFKIK